MQVNLYSHEDIAITDTDQDGPCVITWMRNPDIHCDGWITGGILFAPQDGQTPVGYNLINGEPDPSAGWYAVETGESAIMLDGRPHVMIS